MIPAFIGKNIQNWIAEDKVPPDIKKFGDDPERIFITLEGLKTRFVKIQKTASCRSRHVYILRQVKVRAPAVHGRLKEVRASIY